MKNSWIVRKIKEFWELWNYAANAQIERRRTFANHMEALRQAAKDLGKWSYKINSKIRPINNKAQLIRSERKHTPMVMRSSVINRRTIAMNRENRIARASYYKGND